MVRYLKPFVWDINQIIAAFANQTYQSNHTDILIFICPTGVIFYQNEDGDVMDIQADIIGPGKLLFLRFNPI